MWCDNEDASNTVRKCTFPPTLKNYHFVIVLLFFRSFWNRDPIETHNECYKMYRGDSSSLPPRNVWRSIQCHGVRTVGTIARRSIQLVWPKIFTQDCDDDCQTTSKCANATKIKEVFHQRQTTTTATARTTTSTTIVDQNFNHLFNKIFSTLQFS